MILLYAFIIMRHHYQQGWGAHLVRGNGVCVFYLFSLLFTSSFIPAMKQFSKGSWESSVSSPMKSRVEPWPKSIVDYLHSSVVRQYDDNFQKPQRRKFIFEHPVYFQGIWVTSVHEDQRVKVKSQSKKVENLYFRTVKLPLAKTLVL